jgi:hypothetical protein
LIFVTTHGNRIPLGMGQGLKYEASKRFVGIDYEAEKLRKRKEDRIRKNKRNSRGRAQTQGAALGAVSNIYIITFSFLS